MSSSASASAASPRALAANTAAPVTAPVANTALANTSAKTLSANIEEEFRQALEYASFGPKLPLSDNDKLKMYALFKQAKHGACTDKAPSRLRLTEHAKWSAWHSLGKMSKEEAMRKYVKMTTQFAPGWRKWQKTPQARL